MARAYARWQPAAGPPVPSEGDSLMARVAGERSIALNSETYRRGIRQFEDNLGRLLARYRSAGVPVFIGTLVSNERDQPPLAVLAGSEGDAAGAAKTAFNAAQDAEAAGQYDAAREGYAWARDLDPLRFRDTKRYADRLREARDKTNLADAMIVAHGKIGGHAAVVGAFDFEFQGGSMGSVVGEKIAIAAETARATTNVTSSKVGNTARARTQVGDMRTSDDRDEGRPRHARPSPHGRRRGATERVNPLGSAAPVRAVN